MNNIRNTFRLVKDGVTYCEATGKKRDRWQLIAGYNGAVVDEDVTDVLAWYDIRSREPQQDLLDDYRFMCNEWARVGLEVLEDSDGFFNVTYKGNVFHLTDDIAAAIDEAELYCQRLKKRNE